MESPYDRAAENEGFVRAQLFCGLSKAIYDYHYYSDDRPRRVLAEVPTGDGFADVVVTKQVGRDEFPIIVIECKQRILEALGSGFAKAASQSMGYAFDLDCPTFAIYDGSVFLLFSTDSPFLLTACGVEYSDISSGYFCHQLLTRLMEKQYLLGRLQQLLPRMAFPPPPDKALLKHTIFPVVARALVRRYHQHFSKEIDKECVQTESESLLFRWNEVLEQI